MFTIFGETRIKADTTQANDNWPTLLHDPQHTGYSGSTAPNTNSIAWIANIGDSTFSGPIADNGLVIVNSNNGIISAFNATTGERKWVYSLNIGVSSSALTPTVDNQRIFIAHYNSIYCINESTGSIIWSFETGGSIPSVHSPTVIDNKVLFNSGDTYTYCLNANDGALLWKHQAWAYGSPSIYDVIIIVSGNSFNALNLSNGQELWSFDPDSSYGKSSVAIKDGIAFFATGNSSVYSLNAYTGALIWKQKINGQLTYSNSITPAIANGKLFLGSDFGFLSCLNASTGSVIWTFGAQSRLGSTIAADGKVFTLSDNGKIFAVGENSGLEIWNYSFWQDGYGPVRNPAIYDGKVFVTCQPISGVARLYAFGLGATPFPTPTPTSSIPAPTTTTTTVTTTISTTIAVITTSLSTMTAVITQPITTSITTTLSTTSSFVTTTTTTISTSITSMPSQQPVDQYAFQAWIYTAIAVVSALIGAAIGAVIMSKKKR